MSRLPQNESSYIPLGIEEFDELWSRHRLTSGRCPRILEYDAVIRARSLADLFRKNDSIILYYPTNQRKNADKTIDVTGHYTCMVRRPDGYHYYDSYGEFPDTPKTWSKQRQVLYANEGRVNSLIRLLKKAHDEGLVIDYSHYKHQHLNPRVATCGYHCLTRCLFSDLSNDEYNKMLQARSKKWHMGKDDVVSTIW